MLTDKQLRDIFIAEFSELLGQAEQVLLAAEKNGASAEDIDGVMRRFHTIKSSAASMGYRSMSELSHAAESLIGAAQAGTVVQDADFYSRLLSVHDLLLGGLQAITAGNPEPDCSAMVAELKAVTEAPPAPKKAASKKKKAVEPVTPAADAVQADETWARIPSARLDALMTIVEEFVTARAAMADAVKGQPAARAALHRIDRLGDELRFQVMQTRLMPLSQALERFPRMVRDLAAKSGKDVQLKLEGGEVEMDRAMLSKAAEPLLHLIRNAVDHGIGTGGGTVTVRGRRHADHVVLTVENDGDPVDFEALRAAAVRSNLMSAEQAAGLDERGLRELLWTDGLSTSERVTETSGRGVGMAIVRRFVREVGGMVDVVSPRPETGDGTAVTVTLPLSIAILPALIVNAAGRPYAIPYGVIDRSLQLEPEALVSMADQDAAVIDGVQVPLVHLDRVTDPAAHATEQERPSVHVVVVTAGGGKAGIAVGQLLGQQEIVVKPMPMALRNVPGFSGTAALGDGRTALVVEPQTLFADPTLFVRVRPH